MKVLNWKTDKETPVRFIWEAIVEGVSWVLNNKQKDQIATKAAFEGSIDNPDVNIWFIIGQLLRNAFIEALYPALENSVNINTPKKEEKPTLLEKIFKKNKKDKDKK
jgi:hypothetical protein